MGYFFSLRGWLETDEEERDIVIETLQSMIDSEDDVSKLYLKGWCWCNVIINWTSYIFYGADVRPEGLDQMEDTLARLLKLCPELRGYFHAQGEDSQYNYIYKLSNGVLTVEDTSALVEG